MPLVWDPGSNSYIWDYSDGGPPNSQAPWDPGTGQPLGPPPNSWWDPGKGGWEPTPTQPDPTTPPPPDVTTLNGDPTTQTRTEGGGGGLSAPSGRPSGGIMDWGPTFTPPTFAPPAAATPFTYQDFAAPAPFQFEAFQRPSLEQAQNEPGYAFAAEEGRKALEGSKAAEGVYRTGGTLKDLYSWGNKFAEQNYGNVVNRAANEWTGNRNNAFANYQMNEGNRFNAWTANRNNAASNYATNYGVSKDVFDRNYQGALDAFAPKQRFAELDFGRQWGEYLAKLDAAKTIYAGGQA